MKAETKTGIDISAERLDVIERQAISDIIQQPLQSAIVNLGCGKARSSIILSLLGYRVVNFDIENLDDYFSVCRKIFALADNRLVFKQLDIASLTYRQLPKRIGMVIANRSLHYLSYTDALDLLKKVTNRMEDDAKIYIGLSGADTQLAVGYDNNPDINTRHGYLDPEQQKRFHIHEKITLYGERDAEQLVQEAGLDIVSIKRSAFGNWKIVAQKCDTITE